MPENKFDEDELEIDLTRLDDEWRKQPKLFVQYSRELADSKAVVERLKSALSVREAEIHMDVLAHAENLPKQTDAVIKQAVAIRMGDDPLAKKLRLAKHKVDLLQAFVESLDQKKRALEGLVSLHGQGYFSEPRATNEHARKWVEDMQDKTVMKYRERRKVKGKTK